MLQVIFEIHFNKKKKIFFREKYLKYSKGHQKERENQKEKKFRQIAIVSMIK